MIGSRLGSYEITAKLGEGGMGEVYRATDTKLERQVAIKVLPAAFTEDKERLARFEREAKLLAQLHHPNIASIFGLEESDGTRALIMELVEGPTLAERLEQGPLPFNESLSISLQIAQALEEAHEKGIVHRDLKPQNIKASIEGKVKVLDFGLAKAMDPTGSASGAVSASRLAASPTLTLGATVQGMILGTAAYMSPEQARGAAVDKRADIWAFGVVLYEMLVGRSLFAADTVTDTLAGVLKTDIDFSRLPASTPAAIRRLLRRCLERDPKLRLRDIGEARVALGGADEAEPEARDAATAARALSRGRLAVAALALLALGAVAVWHALRPGASVAAERPTFALRRLTELPGWETHPALSPDGRQVVYSGGSGGNSDLFLLRVGGGRAINLTADSPVNDLQAAFSPDGETLVFRSARDGGGLFLMGATGESVRRLTDGGYDPAWSPDGRRVAYSSEGVYDPYSRAGISELWIVDVATGAKRRRLAGDAVQPAWSPDDQRIAYWANDDGQRDLWTVGVDAGDPVAVTADAATDWSPAWSPDGRWLYFASDRTGGMNLFRIPIDPTSGGAAGAPETVTTSVGNLAYARFSADGRRMVVAAYEKQTELSFYRFEPEGELALELLRTLRPRTLQWCDLSPDAAWLACSTAGSPEDLVLLRADGSELRRLTDDAHKDRSPEWSPDGARLLFLSTRDGGWRTWTIRADGSELRRVTELGDHMSAAWSADGRQATIRTVDGAIFQVDVDRLTQAETVQPLALPESLRGFLPGGWSPSGRFLAGTELEGSWDARSVGTFEPATGAYRPSDLDVRGNAYTTFGSWLPDSRRYLATGSDGIALVDAETGRWRPLGTGDLPRGRVRLSADARTMLVETFSVEGDIWLLERTDGAE